MILSCQNLSKAFNEKPILKDVSFHIEEHDKAAIVGINGVGKTTLLRIIVGELPADSGIVTLKKEASFGYLAQNQNVNSENTIYEELLSVKAPVIAMEKQLREMEEKMHTVNGSELDSLMENYARLNHQFELENGYAYQSEIGGVLKGLGFAEEDFGKQISTLSGGQKTRVALSKLLLKKPELIILDEPTNHLDLNAIAWLENYLLNYKGAVLTVSHDRYFLDRFAGKIIEIDQTKATTFLGNYTAYATKKEILRTAARNAYLNQQQEIRHQEAVIEKLKSFNREKSIKRAESREKMLNKIEVLEKPTEARADIHMTLTPRCQSGNDVLHIEHLAKSFDDLSLFQDISMDIKRGEHVAIIGDNGTGKTTILKIINDLVPADSGTITLGTNVHIGYYDQEHHVLHPDKTLFDEISDEYPSLTGTQIRNTLAAFLFTGDDVFKLIRDLSGGERGRVSLAKLMLSESNFLILDEPTNHLDIASKEILEDAVNAYEGTVLYVSHDRYFINRTASRILELSDGQLTGFLGNYDYYLEKKTGDLPNGDLAVKNTVSKAPAPPSEGMQDWKAQKEQQAKQRKKENDIRKCEEEIAKLEEKDKQLDNEMALPENATNVAKLQELTKEKESISAKLEELYEKWETLEAL
ncbi:ABC-F family ATP-binding cassette domain-containing protein [Suilimivivens sp.]|uniref:ABC-F family ATP-binding cassette domain-containing protein n=1 Tax=Suilimivivens sp. TaxID=2981669 RepID=UPI003077EACB